MDELDMTHAQKIKEARRIFKKYVKSHEPDMEYLEQVVALHEEDETSLAQLIREEVENWRDEGAEI